MSQLYFRSLEYMSEQNRQNPLENLSHFCICPLSEVMADTCASCGGIWFFSGVAFSLEIPEN